MPRAKKDPAVRQRTNKAATAAELEPEAGPAPAAQGVPELPADRFPNGDILDATRQWWQAVWTSPMAARFLTADVEDLVLLAVLRDMFYRKPSPTLAAEIRQQGQRFGLAPYDRRRLEWSFRPPSDPDKAEPLRPAATPQAKSEPPAEDPRKVLYAL